MPFFSYKCPSGHTKDTVESIHSDPNPLCEECECPNQDCEGDCCNGFPIRMTRQIGATSFSFKGGAPTPNFGQRAAAIRRKFG